MSNQLHNALFGGYLIDKNTANLFKKNPSINCPVCIAEERDYYAAKFLFPMLKRKEVIRSYESKSIQELRRFSRYAESTNIQYEMLIYAYNNLDYEREFTEPVIEASDVAHAFRKKFAVAPSLALVEKIGIKKYEDFAMLSDFVFIEAEDLQDRFRTNYKRFRDYILDVIQAAKQGYLNVKVCANLSIVSDEYTYTPEDIYRYYISIINDVDYVVLSSNARTDKSVYFDTLKQFFSMISS